MAPADVFVVFKYHFMQFKKLFRVGLLSWNIGHTFCMVKDLLFILEINQ